MVCHPLARCSLGSLVLVQLPDRGIDRFRCLEKRPLFFRHARGERSVESAHLLHERVEAYAEGRRDLLDVAR